MLKIKSLLAVVIKPEILSHSLKITVISRSNAHLRLNAHPPTLFKSQVFFLLISNVSQAPTPLKIMNANFGAHGRLSERLRYKLKLRGRTGNE